jgi:protein-disulfide isomerase
VVAVLAALAVVVVVAVVVTLSGRSSTASVAATYPVRLEGAVVVAGQQTARTTVDIYEDYLCPVCARFEQTYGSDITQALNDGQIQVRFHGVAILSSASKPAGYSQRAGNAALCSVDAKIFPAYHQRLFTDQPAEGSAGKSNDELVALGRELGAQGDFENCVRSGKNIDAVVAETNRAIANAALRGPQGFGTPTVLVGGQKVDLSNSNWLQDAIQRG